MKFKTLLSKIESLNENSGEHTEGGGLYIGDPQGRLGPSALTDKGTFNIKLPHSIDAINAMLGAFSAKDYIDPTGVLAVVKQKLNHFGFDFDAKAAMAAENEDGAINIPLVQYGSTQLGVYGQNPYEDVNKKGFSQGDGIKEKIGHGLDLVVNIQKNPNGLKKVNIVIAPSSGPSPVDGNEGESDCGCMH
jgi:hypothetical protein